MKFKRYLIHTAALPAISAAILKTTSAMTLAAVLTAKPAAAMTAPAFSVQDTVVSYNMDVLTVSELLTRDNKKIEKLPLSYTKFDREGITSNRIYSMKAMTGIVPNLYIPDYGSKGTASIYIRGIGSRVNSPAVGIYVDGIPQYDKSAFDFDYADIETVEVLRGPQGTLYGRNSMGGLINITTKSPFDYTGTDLFLGGGTKNSYRGSLTHYHRKSRNFAFSAGGFYNHSGGFFKNRCTENLQGVKTGKNIDTEDAGGGRLHAILYPSDNHRFRLELNVNYEYSDNGGYPYGLYEKEEDRWHEPSYNFKTGYYRNLLNTGFLASYIGEKVVVTSVTGWQYLRDRTAIDQDYTSADEMFMILMQKKNTLSEELVVKNRRPSRLDWTGGVSLYKQWERSCVPMEFRSAFIGNLQQTMTDAMHAAGSPVDVVLTDTEMKIPQLFHTPTFGAAPFGQVTLNRAAGIRGLSLTAGIRVDYQKVKAGYNSGTMLNYAVFMRGRPISEGLYSVQYLGDVSNSYSPVLPKVAIRYEFSDGKTFRDASLYATASRGYRSGGYNIQILSSFMPEHLQKNVGVLENDAEINGSIRYKPEFSWNFEAGAGACIGPLNTRFSAVLFYMDIKDQQVARFSSTGLGRYTSNEGKSRSYGAELSLQSGGRLSASAEWNLHASYGYTDAKFTNGNFDGKYVPFSPEHTLSITPGLYFRTGTRTRLGVSLTYNGLGKVYFTESNDVSQKYYSLLKARLSLSVYGSTEIALWADNLTDNRYATFYFESGSAASPTGFMQRGKPVQAGVDVRFRF